MLKNPQIRQNKDLLVKLFYQIQGGFIMSKEYENQNVSYVIHGNYQLPCITTKEQNELHIGVWANRHRQYLKQHHRIKYYNLLTSERLYPYLADIEEQAEAMFSQLVKAFAEKENVTEKLKADNSMLWVRKMNNIRNRARVSVVTASSLPSLRIVYFVRSAVSCKSFFFISLSSKICHSFLYVTAICVLPFIGLIKEYSYASLTVGICSGSRRMITTG